MPEGLLKGFTLVQNEPGDLAELGDNITDMLMGKLSSCCTSSKRVKEVQVIRICILIFHFPLFIC